MLLQLLPGIAGLIIGLLLQKYAYDENGKMKGTQFLLSVSIGIIAQGYLAYEYIILRGGFKIHNCIFGVTFALFLGAVVLWASRMLFAFDHEGFRVLLGVGAIISGLFTGNGVDIIVACKQGLSLVEMPLVAYGFFLGALFVLVSGSTLALKVFSLKPLKIYDTIFFTSMTIGIILIATTSLLI